VPASWSRNVPLRPPSSPVTRSMPTKLAGLRGEGGFRADLGESAQVTLDYWFE